MASRTTASCSSPAIAAVPIRHAQEKTNIALKFMMNSSFLATMVSVVPEPGMREVDKADYCDIVQMAQLHCAMVGGRKVEAPPMSELPAFRRLHLGAIDPVTVIQQSRQEISEIVSLLTS